ncbi:MAG: PDZ domain-containing protein [Planctomycetes bacterium]|nr:PDZ domain-containing protein [Planctomycetota bacterium]
MKTRLALSFVALLLAACTTYTEAYYLGAEPLVLATRTLASGQRETWRLDVRSSLGDATLRREVDGERDRPWLGLRVVEIDGAIGQNRGVQPYSGLLVQEATAAGPGAAAGVLAGDVLLALDAQPMAYLAQFGAFEAGLAPRQLVRARLLRGQTEVELDLQADATRQRRQEIEDFALEVPPRTDRPFAGVTLRGIPRAQAEAIFGAAAEAVVITAVEVGSPAWRAGLRGGDRIEQVDGGPVPTVAQLSSQLRELGAAGATTTWHVRRGTDPVHEATLELGDYGGETRVWIPLVFGLTDGVLQDRWSIGPLGLLMSHRSHYLTDQRTRAVRTRNVFNLLFGLFHVDTTPATTQVRLLWLIEFGG